VSEPGNVSRRFAILAAPYLSATHSLLDASVDNRDMRPLALLALCAFLLPAQNAPKKSPRRKAAPVPAAKPAEAPSQLHTIVSLRVEGNNLYKEGGILSLTGLTQGQQGSKEMFDAARDRLLATGLFETVGYRYQPGPAGTGYALTFEVLEIGQVYPVRFTRLGVSDEDATAALAQAVPLFNGKIPPTKPILALATKALTDLAAAKAAPIAISTKVTSDNPADLHILFYPTGAPPIVAEVHFRGNKILPSPQLQLAIHGVAVGTEYREPYFRQVLTNAIVPLYEARGRLRVKFPSIAVSNAEKVKGIALTVTIEEGESYKVSRVSVTGAEPLNEDLLALAKIKEDDIANFDEVRAAQARIADNMKQRGYLRIASTVERVLNDEKLTAELTIRVAPGPQYTFRKLVVTGLDLIGTPAVEKRWALEPGKPYNAAYPQFFINRIVEERMFEDLGGIKHEAVVDDANYTVDVKLIFAPQKPPEKKAKF
jgi:outer membrane protein insertion porin family